MALVDGGNGRFYTRDHPHEIISPHVMRFEEIREWLRILSTDPAYGWAVRGGRAGLERSLGLGRNSLDRKLKIAWLWPKEQVRLTHRINDVLDGHIVPRRFGVQIQGVYVDPPQPPVVNRPKMIHMQVLVGEGLKMVPTRVKRPPALPEFRDAFARAPTWKMK